MLTYLPIKREPSQVSILWLNHAQPHAELIVILDVDMITMEVQSSSQQEKPVSDVRISYSKG